MRVAAIGVLAGILLLGATGCGGMSLYPVSGEVKYADGSPVDGVTITLTPAQDSTTTATTIHTGQVKNGKFEIMTGDKPGAPAGKYKVTFTTSVNVTDPNAATDPTMAPKRLVAPKYENPDTTPIIKEVTSGSNTWNDLQVEKPAPGEEGGGSLAPTGP